ncbi:Atxe2 family lasso peptide isopeptidase [Hyphococcus luteus]|uniref:Dipeptidyl aminopeptidase n=1 Tax=Hyphococcus luteus TaxID=2058213 RepID=A0A2S7K4Z0_9PROT|nr:Atxe2 family lasso peptide isopeptidase [Marinicaulis flavus]PQA87573.1 dipeptidyl aminopeptidase [Marinicaulis flavus]
MVSIQMNVGRCAVFAFAAALALTGRMSAHAEDEGLRALVEITDFTGVSISPDGRYAAYRAERASVEENAYSSEWFIYRLDGGASPKRVADGGAPIFTSGWALGEWPQWSSDSGWLYFRALHDGEVQLWRASVTGTAKRLTDDPADVIAFDVLPDGNLAFEVGATRAEIEQAELDEYYSGILIDGTVPLGQGLFRSGFHHGRLATQRYLGKWMNVTTLLGDRPTQIKVVDIRTGRVRKARDKEAAAFRKNTEGPTLDGAPGRSEHMHVTEDGRAVWRSKDEGERTLHARIDDKEIICSASECARPIAWVSWRGLRHEVIFATRDRDRGDAMTVLSWNIDRNSVRTVREAPGLLHSGRVIGVGIGCGVGDRYAFCVSADANTPPRIEQVDLDSGEARVIAAPNRDFIRLSAPRAELMQWRDSQDREFTGYFIPAAAGETRPSPLFILYYACQGYLRGGPGDEWPLTYLAEAGVAVLCISAYPSPDAGGPVVKEYDTALAGIDAAIDVLAARGIDPARVGIGGFSFGASVAMWVAYHSDLIAAASLATPDVTETYYWQRALMGEAFKGPLSSIWELAAPDATPEQWRRISPSHNLDRLRFPLLMQIPEQEYLVALEYFVPLIESGAPTEVHVFPHEPHYTFQPRHRLAAYQRNLDWFRFWLLGEEAGGARPAQFERWRKLRERAEPGEARSGDDKPAHAPND